MSHDLTLQKIILKQFLRFHQDANEFTQVVREVPLAGCLSLGTSLLGSQSKSQLAIEH